MGDEKSINQERLMAQLVKGIGDNPYSFNRLQLINIIGWLINIHLTPDQVTANEAARQADDASDEINWYQQEDVRNKENDKKIKQVLDNIQYVLNENNSNNNNSNNSKNNSNNDNRVMLSIVPFLFTPKYRDNHFVMRLIRVVNSDKTERFIDCVGRVYNNFEDWKNSHQLPQGEVVYFHNGHLSLQNGNRRPDIGNLMVRNYLQLVGKLLLIASSVIEFVALILLFRPNLRDYLAIILVVFGVCALFGLIRGVHNIYDRVKHRQTLTSHESLFVFLQTPFHMITFIFYLPIIGVSTTAAFKFLFSIPELIEQLCQKNACEKIGEWFQHLADNIKEHIFKWMKWFRRVFNWCRGVQKEEQLPLMDAIANRIVQGLWHNEMAQHVNTRRKEMDKYWRLRKLVNIYIAKSIQISEEVEDFDRSIVTSCRRKWRKYQDFVNKLENNRSNLDSKQLARQHFHIPDFYSDVREWILIKSLYKSSTPLGLTIVLEDALKYLSTVIGSARVCDETIDVVEHEVNRQLIEAVDVKFGDAPTAAININNSGLTPDEYIEKVNQLIRDDQAVVTSSTDELRGTRIIKFARQNDKSMVKVVVQQGFVSLVMFDPGNRVNVIEEDEKEIEGEDDKQDKLSKVDELNEEDNDLVLDDQTPDDKKSDQTTEDSKSDDYKDDNSVVIEVDENRTYKVLVSETEASLRCGLTSESEDYKLLINDKDILLFKAENKIFAWPYECIRNSRSTKYGFSILVDRNCSSDAGLFSFITEHGQVIDEQISRKQLKCLQMSTSIQISDD